MVTLCNANKETKKSESAYLTVYLSLTFGLVLSLLLALIEGAAIGAVRAQAEIVADLGLDSVFAEYHRELLDQYELFFIDTSYGTGSGGTGMVQAHLSDYMGYNMDPENDLWMNGAKTLLKLRLPHLEIDEVSYASDEYGAVWKKQAVAYMKASYGGDFVSHIKEQIDTAEGSGYFSRDIAAEVSQQKQAFEEALSKKEIVEYAAESEEGYSYQKVSGLFDTLIGGGLLTLVFPDAASISGAYATDPPYVSSRMVNGKTNKGAGIHKGTDKPDKMSDELIYGEYLMQMCGNYAQPKEDGLLKYQIEYILYGNNSDMANLRACVERLFALRAVSDYICVSGDSVKQAEAKAVAAVVCTLLLVPELSDALSEIILGIWALAEAAVDVHQLLDGGKVPLIKESGDWSTSLSGLFSGGVSGSSKKRQGMSYQDYLRLLLGFMGRNEKVMRSLDIVEMDIRLTGGNEHFRIDRCIDYMKVSFGFEDAGGHGFVFWKAMCYGD